jgi:hypothetical protein
MTQILMVLLVNPDQFSDQAALGGVFTRVRGW